MTDVCVVGAGAGGAVAAWALVRRGARVTLLETGPRFAAERYPAHAQDAELVPGPLAALADDPAHESYEAAPGEPLDPAFAHLASDGPTHHARPGRRARRPFYYHRALGVGGSTLHYQGEAHRFPAHAFRMRSLRGVGADWPLTYEELAPYYERVERLLGVAGDPVNPFKPPRGPYLHSAHPLAPLSRRVRSGAKRLGLHVLANPLAILPRAAGRRAACHYCNGCVEGCAVGAKSSVDVAVLPEAEASGRLRVVTGFRAARLELRADGRVAAVVGFDGRGSGQRIAARAFVLACGAIETPRLLLNSASGMHPDGLGNGEGRIGRGLMETLYVARWGTADPALDTAAGVPLDSRIWDENGAAGADDLPVGFVLGHGCGTLRGPVSYALHAADGFGASHRARLRRAFGGGYTLVGIAEQLPREENRVVLAERRDPAGLPLARVATRLDGTDIAALARMWTRLGELADASGLGEPVAQACAYDIPVASHVGGTCPMGTDPKRSAVDAFGTVHGVPNLVIADASVLVTQGAGDSPSLTIQALALRSAEALSERARRGED